MSNIGAELIRDDVNADLKDATASMHQEGYAVIRAIDRQPVASNYVAFDVTKTADLQPAGVIRYVRANDPTRGTVVVDGIVWVQVTPAVVTANVGSRLATTTTAGLLKVDNTNGRGRVTDFKTVGSKHYAKWDIRAE